jgi:(R,R)-butanediol dehydrogenase/meso-butanediol dehydrogenase/diacetyl reductase/L-iditol 2-dehydrogenase
MKSLVMTKIGDPKEKTIGEFALADFPMPEPGAEDILIKVAYASICGSDIHFLKGEIGNLYERIKRELPRQVGHEISGTIEKVGERAKARGFKPGDKITAFYNEFCNSCCYCREVKEDKKIFCPSRKSHHDAMSQYVCWHMSQVYKLPDDADLKDACMAEPLSVAVEAIEKADIGLGSRVAIFGGGGIGLMLVQLAKMAGASTIALIEPVATKREIALQSGADFAIDPINEDVKARAMEITNQMGFDRVLESSGAASAAKAAVEIAINGGHVLYFSMYNPEFEMSFNLFTTFYQKGITVSGALFSDRCFERAVRMLPRMDFRNIIQRVHPLADYEKAFADAQSGQYIKVVLKCN